MADTNKLLAQILAVLNAYHMATLTDEQKKKYIEIIKSLGFDVSFIKD